MPERDGNGLAVSGGQSFRNAMAGLEFQQLPMRHIACNVLFNVLISMTIVLGAVSLFAVQWVESSEVEMLNAKIYAPIIYPGIKKVSCGLVSYCVLAAAGVADCDLPWSIYGNQPSNTPSQLWGIAAASIGCALVLLGLTWIYTLFACFGCYSPRAQNCSSTLLIVSGGFLVLGVVLAAVGVKDLAVDTCLEPINATLTSVPPCQRWQTTLPFDIAGQRRRQCRICGADTTAVSPAVNCHYGFGLWFAIVACPMAFIAAWVGTKMVTLTAKQTHQLTTTTTTTAECIETGSQVSGNDSDGTPF